MSPEHYTLMTHPFGSWECVLRNTDRMMNTKNKNSGVIVANTRSALCVNEENTGVHSLCAYTYHTWVTFTDITFPLLSKNLCKSLKTHQCIILHIANACVNKDKHTLITITKKRWINENCALNNILNNILTLPVNQTFFIKTLWNWWS